jgi:DNA-binding MarR family transcriptional regulator
LAVTAGLAAFTAVRDAIALTDGNLNRHVAKLESARLIAVSRPDARGRASRTRLAITADGRRALTTHVATLRRIIDDIPDA